MNFKQAVKSCFKNYIRETGRAPRSEYWFWVLFLILGHIATLFLDGMLFGAPMDGLHKASTPLNWIFSLVVFLPGIAVGIRRLHDIDRNGWWLLVALIPLIGAILLLIWFFRKGTPGPNRFGSDPLMLSPVI